LVARGKFQRRSHMFSKITQLYKNYKSLGLYIFSNLFGKGLSFLSFPIFINALSTEDVGILGVFSGATILVTIFLSGAFLYSMDVEYFKHSKENYSNILSSTIYIPFFFSLIAIAVIWTGFGYFSSSFSFQPEFILLLPLCALNMVFYEASLALVRNREKPVLYIWFNIIKIVPELGIALCLIKIFSWNWEGRVIGILISGFLCTVFFVYYAYKLSLLRWYFNWDKVKAQLKFALFPMFMQLAVFFVTTSDRFFITNYYSVEETAVYNVAAILAGTIFVFISAAMTYLLPRLYRTAPFNWQNTKHLFFGVMKIMGISMLVVVAVSMAIFKWYLKPGYEESIPIFFVLLLSYCIWNMAGYFSFIINFYKNKKVLAIIPSLLIVFAFLNFTFFAGKVSFRHFVYSELLICVFALSVYLFFCKRLGFFNRQAAAN